MDGHLPIVVTGLNVLAYCDQFPRLPSCPSPPPGQEEDYVLLLFEIQNTYT